MCHAHRQQKKHRVTARVTTVRTGPYHSVKCCFLPRTPHARTACSGGTCPARSRHKSSHHEGSRAHARAPLARGTRLQCKPCTPDAASPPPLATCPTRSHRSRRGSRTRAPRRYPSMPTAARAMCRSAAPPSPEPGRARMKRTGPDGACGYWRGAGGTGLRGT
jgi:hypothetical protein